MKKFDIQDRIILDDALDSFLIAAKVHEEEADLLGNDDESSTRKSRCNDN